MKSNVTNHIRHSLKLASILCVAAFFGGFAGPAGAATTGFNQTGGGPYDYNTVSNWVGNTVNGIWDSSLTVSNNQVVTFAASTVLTTGLTFNYGGNYTLTLQRNNAGTYTNTLGGDISLNTGGGTSANVTLGGTSFHLNVDLNGVTRTMTVAANRTLTLLDVVSNGGIIKSGTGTLTLSGANTFNSGLTIQGGTVMLKSSAAAGGTSTITLGDSAGGALDATLISGSSTLNYANAIVLAANTTGILTLGLNTSIGSSTFSGGVTGNNNLTLNSFGTGGTGLTLSALVNNAGTVTIMGSFTTTISGGIGSLVTGITINSGSGNATVGTVTVGSSQAWVNNSANKLTVNGAVTGGANTLTLSGTGAGLTTLTGGLSFTDAGGLSISKSGTAGVTISGGTITLGGTGGITINSGASAVSLGAATISANQAWANNSTNTLSTAGIQAINSQLTLGGSGAIKFGNYANTGTGGVVINGATAQAGNAAAFGTGTLTLTSGTVSSDSGTVRIIANAVALNGPITLGAASGGTGALTFTGGMTVNGSSAINNLQNVTFSTLSTAVGANTLTLGGSGGTLRFTGGMTISGVGGLVISHTGGTTTINGATITLGGTGGITINSGASTVILGAATISAVQTWANHSSSSMSMVGILAISSQLTLTAGTFTFNNYVNTGTGGVVINGATVNAGNDAAFGESGGTLTLTSGSLINNKGSAINFGNNLAITGPVTINAGYVGLTFSGATQSISGSPTITLIANNPVNFGGVALEAGSTTTFGQTGTSGLTQSAPWTGTGAALVFDMEGSATLNQANTFDGGVTVKSGIVDVNHATGLGVAGGNLSVGTASTAAAVVFNANASIGNLTIADNSNSDPAGENRIIINDGYSLTVNPTEDSVANGPVNTSTTGALIKEGTFTLTLNDLNFDYTGVNNVTVNGGKLVSYRGIINPTVNNTAELDAYGSVAGNVIVNGTGLLDLSATYENPMYSLNGDGSITIGLGASMFVGEGDWSGTISGAGSLVPTGYQNGHGASGALIVRTAQAYTGSTFVDTGYTLKLVGATNFVASSAAIIVLTNGFLDVTDTTAFTLAAGQTLTGDGLVNGNLNVGNGSFISPGYALNGSQANRPGTISETGNQTWDGGGTYVWQINDATGSEGTDPGWDLVNITGDLTISATSGNKFTIDLTTLDPGNNPEAMAHFDATTDYQWKIATCSGTLTCDTNAFTVITTHYIGPALGTLSVSNDDHNIYLNHSAAAAAVPASWTNSATSGNWSTAGNWDPAVVPNAYGAVANFTNAFAGDPTLTVDATNTIGTLNVGGAANAGRIITFTNSDNAVLVFRSGNAQLTKAAGTPRTVVAVPLDLHNNLSVSNNSDAGDLHINAAITRNGKTIVNAGAGTGALRMGYSAGGLGPDIVQDSLTSPLVLGADTVGGVHLLSGTVRASDSTAFHSSLGVIIGNDDRSYSATGKTLMLVSDSDLAFVNGGINAYTCDLTITLGRSSSAGPGTKATMLCGLGFTENAVDVTTLTVNRLTNTVYTGESASFAVNSGTSELIFGGVWFSQSQGKNFNIAAGTRLTLGNISGHMQPGWSGLHTTLTKQGAGTLVLSDGMALRGSDDAANRKGFVVEGGTLMVNTAGNSFDPNYLAVSNGAAMGGNSTLDLSRTTLTITPGAILNVPVRLDGTSDALTVTNGSIDLSKLTLRIEDTSQLARPVYTVLTSTHTGTFAGNNLPDGWSVDYTDSSRITLRGPPVHIGTVLIFR
jgi:fibronectin-binding autotransporter adhesin